jgi:hypothetical protein
LEQVLTSSRLTSLASGGGTIEKTDIRHGNENERSSECFLAGNHHRIGVGVAVQRDAELSNSHLAIWVGPDRSAKKQSLVNFADHTKLAGSSVRGRGKRLSA